MAKLFTNHDPYNLHKILGLICLLHYLYRFDHFFRFGSAFGRQDVWIEVGLVALHGLLSLSSLLLPLPDTRNHDAPMIWTEFRFHSILFANRHVIFTILYLLDLAGIFNPLWQAILQDTSAASILCNDFDYTRTTLPAFAVSVAIKASLLICTCNIADWITNTYGSRDERTTNSMAYPEDVTEEDRKVVKRLYAERQFYATIWCMMGSPLLAFAPTFAIQIAPLMMTFVRKGLMRGIWYHRNYALSLQMCYYILSALFFWGWVQEGDMYMASEEQGPVMKGHLALIVLYGTVTGLFTRDVCRFKWRLTPQKCWAINVLVGIGAYRVASYACHNSAGVVRDYITPPDAYVAAVQADADGADFMSTLSTTHLAFKQWFLAKFVDESGNLMFRHLLFFATAIRMHQIMIHTTWQFMECLKVVGPMGFGGWRTVGTGGVFPFTLLFGQREYFTSAALFIVAGLVPTLPMLMQVLAALAFLASTVLVARRVNGAVGSSVEKDAVKEKAQ